MRNAILILILMLGTVIAKAADPVWAVSPASYSFSMTVTAVLQTDCMELTTSNNRLGAFVGGVARGSALNSVNVNGRQLVFLTVYSNTVGGETVTFKIYNAQTDAIVDVVGTLTFQDDASFGTPNDPILMTENHVPTNLALSSSSVMENNVVDYVIGNLSVSDLDAADTHTYSLVAGTGDTDNGSFSINTNQLVINEVADYETKTSYSVRIRGEDNQGCGVESQFTVTVLPFNDLPTDIVLSLNEVNEDAEVGTVVGQLTSVDEDADESFTYALVSGTGDTDNILFMVDGDLLKAVGPFNFEGQASHSIRLRTTDSGMGTFEKEFSIIVLDVNEAPYDLVLNPFEVDENLAIGTVIGDLSATDEDAGDVVTFTLDPSNADQSNWFEIVNNQLLTLVSFNFEELALYSIDVIASDVAGLTATMAFDVSILDANDVPTDLSLSVDKFSEDQPIGTLVGEFAPVDEDAADSHSYSFVSGANDNASFTIDGNQLLSNESFKYNRKDSYTIEVAVTDLAGGSFSKSFTIAIEKLADSVLPSIDLVTPNGDGINDTWFIQDIEKYSNFSVQIYDSSGILIYSVKEYYDNTWNGTQGNRRLSTGTYYYILTSNAGSGKSYKGTISLFN